MANRLRITRFAVAQALRLTLDALKRLNVVIYDPGHIFWGTIVLIIKKNCKNIKFHALSH